MKSYFLLGYVILFFPLIIVAQDKFATNDFLYGTSVYPEIQTKEEQIKSAGNFMPTRKRTLAFAPTPQANSSGESQRAVSANALLKNDVSYLICQVLPDYFTINNNFCQTETISSIIFRIIVVRFVLTLLLWKINTFQRNQTGFCRISTDITEIALTIL